LIDLVAPMAVRVAATLRLADHLRDEARPVEQLAKEANTDAEALERLLRHLVCHGMFAEPRRAQFVVKATAALLRSDHPSGLQVGMDLSGFGRQMDLAFTELLHTVKTGQPTWDRVFGAPFWQFLSNNPAMGASFDATMPASSEYLQDDVVA